VKKATMPTTIGLDIGSSAVRAVQLSTGRGSATVERLGQVLLPAGAVRDGEITDPAAVTEALRVLWSQYGFKGKKVALGVANQQVIVRQVDLPYLPEAELRKSLPFQVQEYIPIPIEQTTLDCTVLEHFEDAEGQRFSRVLVVAAQTLMVNTIIEAVRAAKLDPVLLDLDAFALLRSLAPQRVVAEGGAEMLLGIGQSVTNIVVHENGIPRFVRVLLMGGNGITEGLMGTADLSHEEAEDVKARTGLVVDDFSYGDAHARIIAERAARFVEEIRGSLDYYSAQADAVPVERVVVTGGGSRLLNLPERLADALRVPVEVAHPVADLEIGKVGLGEDQLDEAEHYLAVAIGLAMGAAA
jgi:type IV pilus assembly protein PilM